MTQSQFCLSWNSHKKNICNGLSILQQNGEFVDMTLAADGHMVKVHQIIMALASPYIKELIASANCPHPVIFLNKISYTTLCAILEYVYTGEVLISTEDLNKLVEAGRELHIRGLEEMNIKSSTASSQQSHPTGHRNWNIQESIVQFTTSDVQETGQNVQETEQNVQDNSCMQEGDPEEENEICYFEIENPNDVKKPIYVNADARESEEISILSDVENSFETKLQDEDSQMTEVNTKDNSAVKSKHDDSNKYVTIQSSDTDETKTVDYNAFEEHLMINRRENERFTTSTVAAIVSPTKDTIYQLVDNQGKVVTASALLSIYKEQISAYLKTNQEILLNLCQVQNAISENQNKLAQKHDAIIDSQKKLLHELASPSVQMEDCFSKLLTTIRVSGAVVPLRKSDPSCRESFTVKPIDNVQDLEKFEFILSDETQKLKLMKQHLNLCSVSTGNGVTCAYKFLDTLFTREFLSKCSWSGGSRGEQVKCGLKRYKNVLNFFFQMIHTWDAIYTVQDNERFFKIVTKNSFKRLKSKNLRQSTKRTHKCARKSKLAKTMETECGNEQKKRMQDRQEMTDVTCGEENGFKEDCRNTREENSVIAHGKGSKTTRGQGNIDLRGEGESVKNKKNR